MPEHPVEDLVAVCKKFHIAMLVTRSADGELAARPMFIAKLEA